MKLDDVEWVELVGRVRAGDESAVSALWDACHERLLRYAKRKLAGMPLRAVDEEDVTLSAMNSFFRGVKECRLNPADGNELWKLLATITVRKANSKLRQHYTAKRGGGNVRGESIFVRKNETGSLADGLMAVVAEEKLPELADRLLAICEERLGQLDDQTLWNIALYRIQGYEISEIADKLDCSVATIKRKLNRIREIWAAEIS